MKQEITSLKENYNILNSKTSNQEELINNYELVMSKIPDIRVNTNALQTKVIEIEEKMAEIINSESTNATVEEEKTVILEEKINKLEQNLKRITPLEDQPVIKLLLEQVVNAETTISTHTEELKDMCDRLNKEIKRTEENAHVKEAISNDETNDKDLKKEVQGLAHEMKYVNHAIGKLQTITNEHYRTLLSTVQKTNENIEHIAELAGIVDDITSYHLHLVSSPKSTTAVDPTDITTADAISTHSDGSVQEETTTHKESEDTSAADVSKKSNSSNEEQIIF